MEVYWQFLIQNWVLSGLFLVLLLLLAANELRNRSFGVPGVTSSELINMINHARAVVIDVRDQAVFDQGHILGAVHVMQSDLEGKKKSFQKYKSRPIVLVCENGSISPKVGQWFLNQGFTDIHFLKGGVAGWRSENLPLSKR